MASTETKSNSGSSNASSSSASKGNRVGVLLNTQALRPANNTLELILSVAVLVEPDSKSARYKHGGLRYTNISLKQGLNIVKRADIEAAQASLPEYFASGAIEVIELDESALTARNTLADVRSLSEPQALRAIATERNREALAGWLGTEDRPNVVRSLNLRLSALEQGAEL